MASVQISNLPAAAAAGAANLIEVVQSGTSAKMELSTLGTYMSSVISQQSMPAYTVKANITGATATPQDVSVTGVLDMISSTQGTIAYRNASAWTGLAPSTAGYVLTTNGAGQNPSWVFRGFTVSSTAPSNPSVNDLWIDIS